MRKVCQSGVLAEYICKYVIYVTAWARTYWHVGKPIFIYKVCRGTAVPQKGCEISTHYNKS